MDEEITIIDANTRNEKIRNFFIINKKKLIVGTSIIILIVVGYFSLEAIKDKKKIRLANQYNLTILNSTNENKLDTVDQLTKLVLENDATYSPLALYFLIDNNLTKDKDVTNDLFNELINKTNLDDEIKSLIIYKKALFNSNFAEEGELLQILNPIINSKSIWKSHSLYLIAEYFYSKNEIQKAKEFFNQILTLPNANNEIKVKSQNRLNRDISE